MPVMRLIERRISRFQRDPLSVRNAVRVIVAVDGGGCPRERRSSCGSSTTSEYPHYGRALWWAMQTIPTVGYGDVTPAHTSGRIIATFVMLWGIAFLSILTALITSTFVARAAREHEKELAETRVDPDDPYAKLDRDRRSSRSDRDTARRSRE